MSGTAEVVAFYAQSWINCDPGAVRRVIAGDAEIAFPRRMSLAMRWMVDYSRERSGKTMRDKLANEIMEASHNRGNAVKKRKVDRNWLGGAIIVGAMVWMVVQIRLATTARIPAFESRSEASAR